jgi:hypothetical protein
VGRRHVLEQAVEQFPGWQGERAEGAAGADLPRLEGCQADEGQRLLAEPGQDLRPGLLAEGPPGPGFQKRVGGGLDVEFGLPVVLPVPADGADILAGLGERTRGDGRVPAGGLVVGAAPDVDEAGAGVVGAVLLQVEAGTGQPDQRSGRGVQQGVAGSS